MIDLSAVLVAVIGGLNAITVAALGIFGPVIVKRLGRVRAQVENDHSTNLREELDVRHNETRGWFAAIWSRLEAGDRRFAAHTDQLTVITTTLNDVANRLDDVENTIPPKEIPT